MNTIISSSFFPNARSKAILPRPVPLGGGTQKKKADCTAYSGKSTFMIDGFPIVYPVRAFMTRFPDTMISQKEGICQLCKM
jgi:hypothetical protein